MRYSWEPDTITSILPWSSGMYVSSVSSVTSLSGCAIYTGCLGRDQDMVSIEEVMALSQHFVEWVSLTSLEHGSHS